jgi:ADP-ribose pyrophosphatase YjhB (NUDIX family)
MSPRITTDTQRVLDVFQPGLKRGSERLPYDPSKQYFYVEHPTEGWRVYLRAACFVHELNKGFEPDRFLVVKRTDGDPEKATWEPPKGQMEARDDVAGKTIFELLRANVRREVHEEAKIGFLRDVQHTGLVLQSVEPDFPQHTYFQYHIFSAYAHPEQIRKAFEEFQWISEHPRAFKRFSRDKREKDALAWYDPASTKLMGRWSPAIVERYLAHLTQRR